MAKQIENLTLRHVEHLVGDDHGQFVGEQMFIAMSARQFGRRFLRTGQPYRVDDGRVMRVVAGHAHSIIDMEPYDLERGSLLVVAPGTVFEIEEMDDELDLQTFSYRDLPQEVTFSSSTAFRLEGEDWQLTGEYFDLLWHTANRKPMSTGSVKALQVALFHELQHIYNKVASEKKRKGMSRKEDIFHRFVALVNKHAATEHAISFYADRLCLTPNHLGAVVREVSGQTVMEWIHRYIIQQAKLQLKYSDLPVWQIGEQLNFTNPSFFSKFFRRETGMTPAEYRRKE